MRIFLYIDNENCLSKIDPRTKIIGVFILSGILFSFSDPRIILFILFVLLALCACAKILNNVWRLRYLFISVFMMSAITWPFYVNGGDPILDLGFLTITESAIMYGAAMGIRWATALIIGLIFISTTRADDIYQGLLLLGVPYPFAFVTSLTFRLVPMLTGTGLGIIESQTSRGLDLNKGNLARKIQNYMSITVPLFMHTIKQADFMSVALESKGFSPHSDRSNLREYHFKLLDYFILFFLVAIFLLSQYLRFQGIGTLDIN